MTDLLVTNGRILTQNADREIIESGAVAVSGDRISAVGPATELEGRLDPATVIDADGGAVIPGLINSHTHVSDILLRGSFAEDRGLYDWLINIKQPGTTVMTPEEHALAATLYCVEAIQSGTTTFVENATDVRWGSLENTMAKLEVYDDFGIRNIYAAGFYDQPPDEEFRDLHASFAARDPATVSPLPDEFTVDTETAVAGLESLIQSVHDPENRQSVWPSPVVLEATTTEGLQQAVRIAEEYDVMTTTHVAESRLQEQGPLSSIEYLRNVGYLGERTLLGHCVQLSDRDVRVLARTDTHVAHNIRANMRLGTGFAPIVAMRESGVTVGCGTDNAILSDTVNPLSAARAVGTAHKGYHRDPGVIPAQTAFDMVTRDGATAIGRSADLGSLEGGKRADLAIVDLDHPHLTPAPDPVKTLVYGLQGFEIETVVCAGEVVMDGRTIQPLERDLEELLEDVEEGAAAIVSRAGIH